MTDTRFNDLILKYHIGHDYKTPAVFLSGAMTGLTPEEQKRWRNRIIEILGNDVVVYDPTCFDAESQDNQVQENGFNYDISSIINSDMVILNLNKCMTSVGTCQEIMLAWLLGIPIVGFWENKEDIVPLHPWIEKELSLKFNNFEVLKFYLLKQFIFKQEKKDE